MMRTIALALACAATTVPSAPAQAEKKAGLPEFAELRIGTRAFRASGSKTVCSPHGKLIALAELEKIRLIDAASGLEVAAFAHKVRTNPKSSELFGQHVVDLAFLRDGQKIVSGDQSGTLHVWDIGTGKESVLPERHIGLIALCLSPDQQSFFTVGLQGSLRQWKLPDGKTASQWTEPGRVNLLAVACLGDKVVTVGGNGILYEWDPPSGKETRKVELGSVLFGGRDDLATYTPPKGTGRGGGGPGEGFAPAQWERNVAFSGDGKWMFQQRGQQLWNVATGEVALQLPPTESKVRIAFSAAGDFLAACRTEQGAYPLSLYGLSSLKELRRVPAIRARSMAFAPDGLSLVITSFEDLSFLNLSTLEQAGASESLGDISSWDVAPDGKLLAVSTGDKGVTTYDAVTGKRLDSFRPPFAPVDLVRFHPDGETLILGRAQQGLFHYRKQGGQWQETKKVPQAYKATRAHTRHVETTGGQLLDVTTGEVRILRAGRQRMDIVLSPDIRFAVARVESFATEPIAKKFDLQLLRFADGKKLRDLGPLRAGADVWQFSPDGRLLLHFSNPLRVFELRTGTERGKVSMKHSFPIEFAPDGRTFVSGSPDGELVMFDSVSGAELFRTGKAHPGGVREFRFTGKGKVVTLGADNSMVVWSAAVWQKSPPKARSKLITEDFELFVELLKQTTGANVGPTIETLIGGEDATVAYFKDKVKPAAEASPKDGKDSVPTPEQLLDFRVVEVLERIGTPAARAVLTNLASGNPEAALTRDARASLDRLGRLANDK